MTDEGPVANCLPLSSLRDGPFISGTTFMVYQLGQRIASAEDNTVEALESLAEPVKGRATPGSASKAKKATGKRGGAVNLKLLVDAGLLTPGRNKITVVYKGVTYTASLNKEGQILYQGKRFQSATAFSIHCKRQQTPNKQGDDGWKSTLYEGSPLETFRKRFGQAPGAAPVMPKGRGGRQKASVSFVQPDDEMVEEVPEGAPAGMDAAAESSTDQWVQCDRCRTWRIVPDSGWAAVEADERDVWYCEDATWEVATQVPRTPACKQ